MVVAVPASSFGFCKPAPDTFSGLESWHVGFRGPVWTPRWKLEAEDPGAKAAEMGVRRPFLHFEPAMFVVP